MVRKKCILGPALALMTFGFLGVQTSDAQQDPPKNIAEEPVSGHASYWLNNTPEARGALADFHRRKALGLLPHTPLATHDVGDTLTFKVMDLATRELEDIDFQLMIEADKFLLWLELDEVGRYGQADLDSMRTSLQDRTPEHSINPNQGVIANNEFLFGEPPDPDGDGKVDILLLKIRQREGGGTAGFVLSQDLTERGNNRVIMYVDADSNVEYLLTVMTHEHQHLIMMNYDNSDLAFVNEGQSGWAQIINGYFDPPVDYLRSTRSYNVPLMSWGTGSSTGSDYDRATLFTTYLAQRMGAIVVGALTRDARHGMDSYTRAMNANGLNVNDVIMDFHVANMLNNPDLGPRFGYTVPRFRKITVNPRYRIDGGREDKTFDSSVELEEGAPYYFRWVNTLGLSLAITSPADDAGSTIRSVAILKRGPSVILKNVPIGERETKFPDYYDQIDIVVAHVRPTNSGTVGPREFTLQASWSGLFFAASVEDQVYVQGQEIEALTLPEAAGGSPPHVYTLSPALPAGLSFNAGARTLSGTPSETFPQASFTYLATDTDGLTAELTFAIQVDSAPFFAASVEDQIYVQGQQIEALALPEAAGGSPPHIYTLSPALPAGLSFDAGARILSGTPSETFPRASFTYLATDTGGLTAELTFAIQVDTAPFFAASVEDQIYVQGQQIEALALPEAAGGSPPHVYTLSPALPAGLSFDAGARILSGTPSETFPRTSFTYSATDIGGLAADLTFAIQVDMSSLTRGAGTDLPAKLILRGNYPNPFNMETRIVFDLPQDAHVHLEVVNILGRRVIVMPSHLVEAGWGRGLDISGVHVVSGTYLYRLVVEMGQQSQVHTGRMMMIK